MKVESSSGCKFKHNDDSSKVSLNWGVLRFRILKEDLGKRNMNLHVLHRAMVKVLPNSNPGYKKSNALLLRSFPVCFFFASRYFNIRPSQVYYVIDARAQI